MKAKAGSGALLSNGQEIPVRYDIVQTEGPGSVFAEGKVFGDAHALFGVFNAGPCVLRLESGEPVHAFLEDCRSSAGEADIRVTDPIPWNRS